MLLIFLNLRATLAAVLLPDGVCEDWGWLCVLLTSPVTAAALQPTYAPELNLVGVAQGGTPANLTATAEFIVSPLGCL